MDRRQDGTVAALFAAGLAPVLGENIAPHSGYAAKGRATRRQAAGRPPPVSFLPDRTATGAAMRDTGSARGRLSHDRPCHLPGSPSNAAAGPATPSRRS